MMTGLNDNQRGMKATIDYLSFAPLEVWAGRLLDYAGPAPVLDRHRKNNIVKREFPLRIRSLTHRAVAFLIRFRVTLNLRWLLGHAGFRSAFTVTMRATLKDVQP